MLVTIDPGLEWICLIERPSEQPFHAEAAEGKREVAENFIRAPSIFSSFLCGLSLRLCALRVKLQ